MSNQTKKIRDEIIFTGGLDKDSDERHMVKGDWRDAKNILVSEDESGRVVTNMKGNTLKAQEANFSGTSSVCMGIVADDKNNYIYVVWSNSYLYRYDGNSEAFDTDFELNLSNIDYTVTTSNTVNMEVVGDYLIMTDNDNSPRILDTTKTATQISNEGREGSELCKKDPVYPIRANYTSDGSGTNILNKVFQFTYRYIYNGGFHSPWAPVSRQYYRTIPSENVIQLMYYTGGATVNKIQFAMKEGIGDWVDIGVIEQPGVNTFVNRLFKNDAYYGGLDQNEVGRIQHDVPKKAVDATVVENSRLVLSGNTIGFNDVTPNVEVTAKYNVSSENRSFKKNSKRKFGIGYKDIQGRTTSVYTNDDMVLDIPDQSSELSAREYSDVGAEIRIKHQPPEDAYYWQVYSTKPSIQNFEGLVIDKAYKVCPDYKESDYIDFVYIDYLETFGTASADGDTSIEWYELDESDIFNIGLENKEIALSVDTVDSNYDFEPGDRVRFVRHDDGHLMRNYYEAKVKRVVNSVIVGYKYRTYTETETPDGRNISKLSIDGNVIRNGTFLIFDEIDGGNYRLDKSWTRRLLERSDNYYFIQGVSKTDERTDIEFINNAYNANIGYWEIWKPKGEELSTFYEIGEVFEVGGAGTSTRQHNTLSFSGLKKSYIWKGIESFRRDQFQNQDGSNPATTPAIIYIPGTDSIFRYYDGTGLSVKYVNIESPYGSPDISTAFSVNGRVNVQALTPEEKFYNFSMWSKKFFEGTDTNGLNDFDILNRIELSKKYGNITASEQVGLTLKVYQELNTANINIGSKEIQSLDGTQSLSTSDSVLGTVRYSDIEHGNRFGSIVKNDRYIYIFDVYSGEVIRDAANGQFPISGKISGGGYEYDYKMHTYFKARASNILSRLNNGNDNNILLGYDNEYELLYVTFKEENKTIVFHEPSNRWICEVEHEDSSGNMVERYTNLRGRMYSVQNGAIYKHNDNNTRCYFYYDQKNSHITIQSLQHPNIIKVYNSLGLHTDTSNWEAEEITIPKNTSYTRGMFSRIKSNKFTDKEGVLRSAFLKNIFSNADGGGTVDSISGSYDIINCNLGTSRILTVGTNVYVYNDTEGTYHTGEVVSRIIPGVSTDLDQIEMSDYSEFTVGDTVVVYPQENVLNGDELRGYSIKIKLKNTDTSKTELFKVDVDSDLT